MEPMNAAATIIGKKYKKTHSLKTREKKKLLENLKSIHNLKLKAHMFERVV